MDEELFLYIDEDELNELIDEALEETKKMGEALDEFSLGLVHFILSKIIKSPTNLVVFEVGPLDAADLSYLMSTAVRATEVYEVDGVKYRVIVISSLIDINDAYTLVRQYCEGGWPPRPHTPPRRGVGGRSPHEVNEKLVLLVFNADYLTQTVHHTYIANLHDLSFKAFFRRAAYIAFFTKDRGVLHTLIPLAKYGVTYGNPVLEYVKGREEELGSKLRYVGKVGILTLLRSSEEELRRYAEGHTATHYLMLRVKKDVKLSELVLPKSLKDFIETNIVTPLKHDPTSIPSILMIGPPGVGKRTLATAIANELGIPAYEVMINLIGSKYVGESEREMNALLADCNEVSPAIVIFPNIEQVFHEKAETAAVYYRVLYSFLKP